MDERPSSRCDLPTPPLAARERHTIGLFIECLRSKLCLESRRSGNDHAGTTSPPSVPDLLRWSHARFRGFGIGGILDAPIPALPQLSPGRWASAALALGKPPASPAAALDACWRRRPRRRRQRKLFFLGSRAMGLVGPRLHLRHRTVFRLRLRTEPPSPAPRRLPAPARLLVAEDMFF